jgi:hypothetical protein
LLLFIGRMSLRGPPDLSLELELERGGGELPRDPDPSFRGV